MEMTVVYIVVGCIVGAFGFMLALPWLLVLWNKYIDWVSHIIYRGE